MTRPDNDTAQNRQAVTHRIDPARLPKEAPFTVELTPDPAACAGLADLLGVISLRKVRLTGELSPQGRRDWRFSGHLGATVVQPCVVTLEPVTTRIDEPVARLYRADFETGADAGDEREMQGDIDEEPLGDMIDLGAVLTEALALALPLYPRAAGAELDETRAAPPGTAPLSDEETRPFAGLAALRDKLKNDGGENGG